jgi:N-acylglucosamine-6-phosphate 2-epimerase
VALPDPAVLDRGLIVSVQAPEDSPLRDPGVIAAMAEACLRRGAVGVRVEGPEAIGAVRRRCGDALIVGLWKRTYRDSPVYITPCWEDLRTVWACGADVIALDASERPRPGGEDLASLVDRARSDLGAVLMADVDTVAAGCAAARMGCHWVGTTLAGYTEATRDLVPPALSLLENLRCDLPPGVRLICEGGIGSPAQAAEALRLGADTVVVGTAITGLDSLVARYAGGLRQIGRSTPAERP